MAHRIPVTSKQQTHIQDSPQPVVMDLYDEGYQVGDYIYFIVFNEQELPVSLIGRRIIHLCHAESTPEEPCVTVTVR